MKKTLTHPEITFDWRDFLTRKCRYPHRGVVDATRIEFLKYPGDNGTAALTTYVPGKANKTAMYIV